MKSTVSHDRCRHRPLACRKTIASRDGCTVVICAEGAVGGVDVRGGAPGTRETDLLDPELIEKIHAVVLAGGSAFGLTRGRGHAVSRGERSRPSTSA